MKQTELTKPDIEVRITNPQRLVEVVDWIVEHTMSIEPATGLIKPGVGRIHAGTTVYVYVNGDGTLQATTYGSATKANYWESLICGIKFRRQSRLNPRPDHFELHGRVAASFADEVIDAFANRGQRCVYVG